MIDPSQPPQQGSSLWLDAWIKLGKNRLALSGLVILLFLFEKNVTSFTLLMSERNQIAVSKGKC